MAIQKNKKQTKNKADLNSLEFPAEWKRGVTFKGDWVGEEAL